MDQKIKDRLKQVLAERHRQTVDNPELTPAAVLVPFYEKEGGYYLLLTKRTHRVQNHKGQIAFPGGRVEASDKDYLATALREGYEEIGLDPRDVEVLGELDEEKTLTTDFVMHSFVALIPYPYEFRLSSREVDQLVEVPSSVFRDKYVFRQDTVIDNDGRQVQAYYYEYNGHTIWGATARILKKFFDLLQDYGFLPSRRHLNS